ncbi:hypothetical protein QJS04_geneDACA019714 [Acorus gramineus]|uniref:TOG domain-containing protein n=1 Tax=Acorus gramineus TaxID=55184 RepID=A0AAV9BSR1_ACOGR|nr:hypothetical protein QJS04_geneDACA019714 [Acorus gramineus]
MALRPLDNTLPLASPDGPKKRAKIAVTAATVTPRDSGINDENLVVSAVTDVVEYVASENLKALPDPEMKIKSLMERLDSKDWLEVCEALNDARRFALHHASILLPMLDKMMMVLVRSMKNPRSALCKTSIMASADIFTSYGHLLLSPSSSPTTTQQEAFDHLLLQLLLKAFQDKRFVCEEAEKALRTMAASMPPLPLLQKLETYVAHKNPKVRAKAAVSISDCTSKLGIEGMKEFGLRKLLQISADMLNDRLPEAREAARRIAGLMYMAYTGGEEEASPAESWQSLCTSSLAPISAQSIIRIIS